MSRGRLVPTGSARAAWLGAPLGASAGPPMTSLDPDDFEPGTSAGRWPGAPSG
jgi:hypothetical protein